jgi:hypothetical protein
MKEGVVNSLTAQKLRTPVFCAHDIYSRTLEKCLNLGSDLDEGTVTREVTYDIYAEEM